VGNFQKVRKVGGAGAAKLIAVPLRSDFVSAAHHPRIFGGAILAELLEQFVEASVEFALGAVAVKMERQIAGRRHTLFYARRTIACESLQAFARKKKGALADARSKNPKITRRFRLRMPEAARSVSA
jgi:hypothetical protein